jgi:AcrR family transcriptional regulator
MTGEKALEEESSARSPRVERRRRAVRAKILSAAEALMRAGSVDDVTIAQITAAADVGHGTFYLHFQTKHEVMVAIAREHAERLTTRLDALTESIADPAEVVAVSVRYVVRAIREDRLWNWFVLGSSMPHENLRECVAISATRDFQRGRDEGRFEWNDAPVLAAFISGAILGVLSDPATSDLRGDTAEKVAELLLVTLGVPRAEAIGIARRRLPPLAPEGRPSTVL